MLKNDLRERTKHLISLKISYLAIQKGRQNSEGNFYDSADPRNLSGMPALENEESAAPRNNQSAQALKVLTPDQMLSRLPHILSELQAGNNSQKLKKGIRQLLYSLYRSKK